MNLRIGRNIEKLLFEKGWEQKDLASKTQIHRTHIGNIIKGKKSVSAQYALRIAEALNVTVADLTAPVEPEEQKRLPAVDPMELPSTPISEARAPVFERMLELVAENATLKERSIHLQAENASLKEKLLQLQAEYESLKKKLEKNSKS